MYEPVNSDSPKNAATDVPNLHGFEEFLENGDLPSAAPSPEVSQSNVVAPPSSTAPASDPAVAEEQAASTWTLHGLLRKASATLENTIETARREVASHETLTSAPGKVLASAQVTLSSFSAAFTAPVPPPAHDMVEEQAPNGTPYASRTSHVRTLRVNHSQSAEPLLMFTAGASSDLFVVTERSIEAFDRAGAKILQSNMEEARTEGNETPPRRSPTRATRTHARADPNAARALCAVHVAATEEIVVAHDDAVLRVYSIQSGRMGVLLRSSTSLPAQVTSLTLAPGSPLRLLVGAENGIVSLVLAADLTSLAWLHAPEACETPLGVGATSAPVSTVVGVAGNRHSSLVPDAAASALVAVGYADGTVVMNRFEDPQLGAPFAAHASGLGGLAVFFDGSVIVSIGGEEDSSLTATVAETGRCLVRRILTYVPTSICRVTPARCANREAKWVCLSESCFIVGGEDGQIDLFRAVPLSAKKLELRLVRHISEKKRGRRYAVLQTKYIPEEAMLLALTQNGEVRRWHMSREDALTMVTPEEQLRASRYDATNVAKALISGADDGTGTRLAVGEGVITAQRVLAMVQEDEAGLDEAGKDQVVEDFQKKQSEMQEKASQVDGELRRAKLRISRRFANAIHNVSESTSHAAKSMSAAALRAAAVELNAVMEKHAQSLSLIRSQAVEQLRIVLLASLHHSRGDAEKVAQIRQAANDLTKISVDAM